MYNKYIRNFTRSRINRMINNYNTLRQKYIVDGYEEAYSFIQELQSRSKLSETLLANFYCYIIIQEEFKADEILSILQNCLSSSDCFQSLRALTLYHIASVYFKKRDLNKCRGICEQILKEFLGLHYSIETRLQKSPQQISLGNQLQEIIYYVFLMLAYINRKQNRLNDSNSMLEAGRRIIKDRKDVMSLTAKTSSWSSKGETSQPGTPASTKNDYELKIPKNPIKPELKQTKSLNTC